MFDTASGRPQTNPVAAFQKRPPCSHPGAATPRSCLDPFLPTAVPETLAEGMPDAVLDVAAEHEHINRDSPHWCLNINSNTSSFLHLNPALTTSRPTTVTMSNNEGLDAPDADIILRVVGPPKRDFQVHKLFLSAASPVFKNAFSSPRPTPTTSDRPKGSGVAGIRIIKIEGSARALDIVLRLIYPFIPPLLDENLDVLVECLEIADRYYFEGAKARLHRELSQVCDSWPLRTYAIASRFRFPDLVNNASLQIFPSVDLTGLPWLPDDFKLIPAPTYHKLLRQQKEYLEGLVKVIKKTQFTSVCYSCPGGKAYGGELFRLRLSHLIMTGTPVEVAACCEAWRKAYGRNTECKKNCVYRFIHTAISRA